MRSNFFGAPSETLFSVRLGSLKKDSLKTAVKVAKDRSQRAQQDEADESMLVEVSSLSPYFSCILFFT